VLFNFCCRCSFQSSYPSWEPNDQGKQFLQNLRTFREKELADRANRHRFVTSNRNNHPYLLDWYYISQTLCATPRHVSTNNHFEETQHRMVSTLVQNEDENEEYMNKFCNELAASYLGASTSTSIFRESLIQDQHSIDVPLTTRSRWWARSQPRMEHAQTSFMDPPDFYHQTKHNSHDKFSDKGSEDHDEEQYLYGGDYNELSSTAQEDDNSDAGELKLHFADVYYSPP